MPKHSRNKNNNGGKKSKTQRTRSRSGSRRSPAAEGGGHRRSPAAEGGGRAPRGSQLAALAQGDPMPHHEGWGYRLTNIAPSHVQGGPPQTPFGLLPRPHRTRSRSRSSSRNRKP